jgi:succinyl-CoA synthetase beta subunit
MASVFNVGFVAYNADEAVDQAKRLSQETGTKFWVVKAQIHAGGRGKGGGVKLAKSTMRCARRRPPSSA